MKTTLSLILLIGSVIGFFKGDDKFYKQAKTQIESHNYDKAIEVLGKVSEEAKQGEAYLQLLSLSYDSLHNFDKAIEAYSQLSAKAVDGTAYTARINQLKEEKEKYLERERVRLEKLRNCLKCKGSDYFETTITCTNCNGYKRYPKECSKCHGAGKIKCSTCAGTGQSRSNDSYSTSCMNCSGVGNFECPDPECKKGMVTVDCNACQMRGTVQKKVKCDMH